MKKNKGLVLDANILVRAVLGKRVRNILDRYQDRAQFFSPLSCFEEARKHLPAILEKRGIDPSPALAFLDRLPALIEPVEATTYRSLVRAATREPSNRPHREIGCGCELFFH